MTNKPNLVMMTPQVLSVPHLSNLIIVYKNKGLGQHTGYLGSDQGDQPIRTECGGGVASGRHSVRSFFVPPLPPCQQLENMSLFSSTNQSCHIHHSSSLYTSFLMIIMLRMSSPNITNARLDTTKYSPCSLSGWTAL